MKTTCVLFIALSIASVRSEFSSHVMPADFAPQVVDNHAVSVEEFGLIEDGAGFVYDKVIKPIGKNAKKNLKKAISGIKDGAEDAWEALEDGWDSVTDYVKNDLVSDLKELGKLIAEKLCEPVTPIPGFEIDLGDIADTLCGKAIKAIVCVATAGLTPGCEKPVDESDLSKFEKLKKAAKDQARKKVANTFITELEIAAECSILKAMEEVPVLRSVCSGVKVMMAQAAASHARETIQERQPPYESPCKIARRCTICKAAGLDCNCATKSRCDQSTLLNAAKKIAQVVDDSAKQVTRGEPRHLLYSPSLGGYLVMKGNQLRFEAQTASGLSFIELDRDLLFAIQVDNGGYLSAQDHYLRVVNRFTGPAESWIILKSSTNQQQWSLANALYNYEFLLTANPGGYLSLTSKFARPVHPGASLVLYTDNTTKIACSAGKDGCCTGDKPCGRGQGSCLSDSDCLGNLKCGTGNCKAEFGFGSPTSNCCTVPQRTNCDKLNKGNVAGCCKAGQCGIGQGGCTADYQCQGDLVCGKGNCKRQFGWASDGNCCRKRMTCDRMKYRAKHDTHILPRGCCGAGKRKCGQGEGWCTGNNDCQNGLVCGRQGSCKQFQWEQFWAESPKARCCVQPLRCHPKDRIHDIYALKALDKCCTNERKCGQNEGHCEHHGQCSNGMECHNKHCIWDGINYGKNSKKCCGLWAFTPV